MINKNGYIKKEVAELLDMKPNTIAFYANEGLIIPEIANPKGRGTNRKYSLKNMCQLYMFRKLGKWGLSLRIISEIMNYTGE